MTRTALLLLATLLGSARADVLTYPGCGATLQACVDAAGVGDTIQLAADVTPAEEVLIKRSLTVEPAPGVQPALALGTVIAIQPTGDAATAVIIRNLTLRAGSIQAVHEQATALAVTITGNRFIHGGPAPIVFIGEPIKVPNAPYGALTAVVTDNVLDADFADASDGIFVAARYAASLSALAARNVLEVVGPEQVGVRVDSGVASATVDVIGNRLFGDAFGSGVAVLHDDGNLRARVVNNEITGQVGEPDGVEALYVGTENGASDVLVLNNTVVGNRHGLFVGGTTPEQVQATVANNIVAGNEDRGLTLDAGIANRNNLVFANGVDSFAPGPGTRVVDPLFVPGTLWLADDSPARDAGATALVPADVTTDIGGTARVRGAAVDLGAHEHPCPGCDPEPPPASCDDGDPCTLDATDGGACTHTLATGVAAVTCTCARPADAACAGHDLPGGVRRKTERACALIAGGTSRRTIKKATRQFGGALRQARSRTTRRQVGTTCADALARGLGDAVARARGLLTAP